MSETNSPAHLDRTDILLESGTNELEVLVFTLGEGTYGVNVAKVREVITPVKVVASPNQPQCVRGMFSLRGGLLPLVDLYQYLDIAPVDDNLQNRRIIVTEFNGQRAAFLVETVDQIYRMSWGNMRPVPETHGSNHFAITGITEINDQLVLMLDFESIFDHISMQDQLHIENVENPLGIDRAAHRIFMAEDSNFIRNIMVSVMQKSGYTQVQAFNNGHDCLAALSQAMSEEALPSVVITDIEMPLLDGLALTRQIKKHPQLRHIPVVLFSSLITQDTRHKGQQVGADDQLAKPQLHDVVKVVDRWISQATNLAQAA